MYEAAISQVFTLCSFGGIGYDGLPSGTSGVNGGSDMVPGRNIALIRVRIYWCTCQEDLSLQRADAADAFVHEGITTGLKGGRLHLDDEDVETIQDSIHNRALVVSSASFGTAAKFATAPINLAVSASSQCVASQIDGQLACRLINKALTGPAARRRRVVNGESVKNAWEALERCWEEFETLRYANDSSGYSSPDEVIR